VIELMATQGEGEEVIALTAATQGEDEEVIELNLRFICPEDARIVSKFITSHGISLPTILDSARKCSACLYLSELLILLKRNSILGILEDNKKLSFLIFLTQERVIVLEDLGLMVWRL
jgi:hypothetical protein